MPATTAPLCQIRVIGPTEHASVLITQLAEHARTRFGDHATYRTQIRSARRVGHIRAYLTVRRKEECI